MVWGSLYVLPGAVCASSSSIIICRCQVPVKHVKVLPHILRCVRARDSYCATLHKPSYCHLCRRLPVRCSNSVGRGVLEDFPYSEWGVGRDRLSTCAESVAKSLACQEHMTKTQ